jgi:hypothetical protein
VQLSSGCGRNERNAASGQAAAARGVEGAGEEMWQSCSVRATAMEVCVVVSQDDIGTINMVVMGKGELNRGRVSADIWAAHGLTQDGGVTHNGMAWEPGPDQLCARRRRHSAEVLRDAALHFDAHWQSGARPDRHWLIRRLSPSGFRTGWPGHCQLSGCTLPAPSLAAGPASRAFDLLPRASPSTSFVTLWVDRTMTADSPRACRLPRTWRAITPSPLFRAGPAPS